MSLREDCNVILKADSVTLAERRKKVQNRAHRVEEHQKCVVCNNIVILGKESPGITLFYCTHVYHTDCLDGKLFCSICKKETQAREVNKRVNHSNHNSNIIVQ